MKKDTKKRTLSNKITPEQEKADQQLSPFELKNKLIKEAQAAQGPDTPYLNAGRGNPNFFNTLARRALGRLTDFALDISPTMGNISLGFFPMSYEGIFQRFKDYFRCDKSEAAVFLKDAIEYAVHLIGLNPDELVHELTDAARGDFYPDPPRMLPNIEHIVKKYLEQIMISNPENLRKKFDLFATEGATAGMVYAFKSLMENFILKKGDKVAIITPVFSPYLEIPELNDFEFKSIYIDANENAHWQVPPENLEILKKKSVKALYLINPTNPTSVALHPDTIERIAHIVKKHNPHLIILVDAVYSTFVKEYRSIIDKMPYNCITVYSFSKYFGVTGWRLGTIMLYEDNVIDDKLLPSLSQEEKEKLAERYRVTTEDVEKMKFIDRIVSDSRDVALGHTAGLSCPQQAVMALFALFNLLHQDTYKPAIRKLLLKRIDNLYKNLVLTYENEDWDTHYYALIDILQLAEETYNDKDFALYLKNYYYPIDFVYSLSIFKASVCLPGYGFFEEEKTHPGKITPEDRKEWSVRVSLANLYTHEYLTLGQNIRTVLEQYHKEYKKK